MKLRSTSTQFQAEENSYHCALMFKTHTELGELLEAYVHVKCEWAAGVTSTHLIRARRDDARLKGHDYKTKAP